MAPYRTSLWRQLAEEAVMAAQTTSDAELRQHMLLMAAQYLEMAQTVEDWAKAD
jgi:hypothetical protein